MRHIKIVEVVEGKDVDTASSWDEAYTLRDEYQQKAQDAGLDLKKKRYAVRCD